MPSQPLLPIFRLRPSPGLRFVPLRRLEAADPVAARHSVRALQRVWHRPRRPDSNQMPS
jgi:hypothetical protein